MKKIIRTLAVTPKIWELANKVAKEENRSISNLIETLIIEEAKMLDIEIENEEE